MNRNLAESLARFCIEQRNAFDARQWLARREVDGRVVALAAKYLSMTNWYGHAEELEHIAVELYANNGAGSPLFSESKALDFDLPHFSTTVRVGIAQRGDPRPQRGAPSGVGLAP